MNFNKFWIDLYENAENASEDLAVLFDFWKEGEATEEEVNSAYENALKVLEDLEFKSPLTNQKMKCLRL